MIMQNNNNTNELNWYIDSGPGAHMCHSEKLFNPSTIRNATKPLIQIGDGMTLDIKYEGSISGHANLFGNLFQVVLQNVLCVPQVKFILLSASVIRRRGYTVSFRTDKFHQGICKIIDDKPREVYLAGLEVSVVSIK